MYYGVKGHGKGIKLSLCNGFTILKTITKSSFHGMEVDDKKKSMEGQNWMAHELHITN